MEPAQEDKRPLARNPREKGLETALDDARKVAAVRCDEGFIFAFTSHGVETRIALSDDAFWAAVAIAEELLAREPVKEAAMKIEVTEEQINSMVERFLGWKLPANFSPDAGISFKAEYNEHTPWPARHEPTGTNLFDKDQARQMVEYMLGRGA